VKVVAFNGSPRAGGAVARGIEVMADALRAEGAQVEVVHVGGLAVAGCLACMKCRRREGGCAIEGYAVAEARGKIGAADGVILGSPTYYGGIAGNFKCFLDRLFFSGRDMDYKVGATVVSLRRTGGVSVFHQLNNYFNLAHMVIAPGIYWDVIHGNSAEEAERDEEGVQILEVQARSMAWLMKAIAAGRKEAPPPPKRKRTNFIR